MIFEVSFKRRTELVFPREDAISFQCENLAAIAFFHNSNVLERF